MKKKLLATSLALLLTLPMFTLTACGESDPNAPSGYVTASNDKVEYTLFVPKNWVVDTTENSMMTTARVSDQDTSNISMVAYTNETYEVKTDENGKQISPVPEYWADYKESLISLFDKDSEGKSTFVLNEDASGKTMMVGNEGLGSPATGYSYSYTATLGEVELQYLQVIIYRKNTFYIFTYTSTPDLYANSIDDVEGILSYVILP